MASQQLSVRQRVEAVTYLEAVALDLNGLAAALAQRGAENEADAIDVAAKNLLAACWWLSRPLRQPPPPERWNPAGMGHSVPPQQGADQHRQAQ
jgi:hypothetical protein